ncbi:MAG: hypothetical protein EBW05_12125 [Betaproteobacteria bacterium]|nr:hypothetical protein [Betaproteobacteria bacterium]
MCKVEPSVSAHACLILFGWIVPKPSRLVQLIERCGWILRFSLSQKPALSKTYDPGRLRGHSACDSIEGSEHIHAYNR